MIIPIRCFTCGKVLADKYDYYMEEVNKLEKKKEGKGKVDETPKHFEGIPTGEIMNKLGLTRYCCRRHMLGTVDMMDTI